MRLLWNSLPSRYVESCLSVTCPKTCILGQLGAETSLILVNADASEKWARTDHNALGKMWLKTFLEDWLNMQEVKDASRWALPIYAGTGGSHLPPSLRSCSRWGSLALLLYPQIVPSKARHSNLKQRFWLKVACQAANCSRGAETQPFFQHCG